MMGAPYLAAFNVTHAFMPALLREDAGVIVHVGSPASISPWPGATAYTAARWALRGLNEALRQDLLGTGVSSSHVIFGEVSSPYFTTNAVARDQLPMLNRWVRAIRPEECARVLLDVIQRPRPEVIHPPVVRWLARGARIAPPLGRRLIAWGAPRH
jgi:NADP-dependent 3-hydroxy acid dehydrogenase YdfG